MCRRRGARAFLFLALLVLNIAVPSYAAGAGHEALTITKGSMISIDVDNKPLSAILRMMSEKKLLIANGEGGAGESLSLHFSNLTLSQALAKMLKGYNYVLVEEGKGRLPMLTVMGKAEQARAVPQDNANSGPPKVADNRPDPRSFVPPQPTAAPPAAVLPPGQPRQPEALPQTPENNQTYPSGQQNAAPPPLPGQRPQGQPAPSTGVAARDLLNTQQAGDNSKQGGQQTAGGQPMPEGQAQPAESQGVHF
ncbi:MAG: STN domain-containing protein [Syntrophorhabdales bacterium]